MLFQRNFIAIFICMISISLMCMVNVGFAQTPSTLKAHANASIDSQLSVIIEEKVREPFRFFGLASYYNSVSYFVVDKTHAKHLERGDTITLKADQWLVAAGRYNVLALRGTDITVMAAGEMDTISLAATASSSLSEIKVVLTDKANLKSVDPVLNKIKYKHLWTPFAWLARLIEAALVFLQSHGIVNWGMTILVFGVLLKIITIPLGNLTTRAQARVSRIQTQLAPKLAYIKANYKGEKAHNKVMQAHKDLGVSTFYTLTPLIATMIQIPILIAVFNAMGEMPQFSGQSFLWIEDLGRPDALFNLGFTIPYLGNTFNLMPFLMTGINIVSTMTLKNPDATPENLARQKRNLYLMAAAFFFIFYTFPAVMVFYWALVNLLQWGLALVRKKQTVPSLSNS